MAGGVPVVYRSGGGGASASYDWFDFAAAAGYQRFYGAGANHSGGVVYFLTTESNLDSDRDNRVKTGASSDVDFDITFNSPVTIAAADLIINITTYQQNAGNTSFVVNAYHVNAAAVETSIGTITSGNIDGGAGGWLRRCARVTLTKTSFGVGEKLRLNIVYTGSGASSFFTFDPASRQTATEAGTTLTISTDLTFDVPFVVSL